MYIYYTVLYNNLSYCMISYHIISYYIISYIIIVHIYIYIWFICIYMFYIYIYVIYIYNCYMLYMKRLDFDGNSERKLSSNGNYGELYLYSNVINPLGDGRSYCFTNFVWDSMGKPTLTSWFFRENLHWTPGRFAMNRFLGNPWTLSKSRNAEMSLFVQTKRVFLPKNPKKETEGFPVLMSKKSFSEFWNSVMTFSGIRCNRP